MSIICQKCKQPIQSKNDLIVMRQWWFFPRPLHKSCWGNIATANMGVGSISYGTGAMQGKGMNIAINSVFNTIISVILFLLGLFVLVANFQPTVNSGGQTVAATSSQTVIIKLVFFILLSIPLIQRIWSYMRIESKINQ